MSPSPRSVIASLLARVEDVAVRVLYFFNSIDTYYVLAGIGVFLLLSPPWSPATLWALPAAGAVYAICRIGDFHPWLSLALPAAVAYWWLAGVLAPGTIAAALLLQLAVFAAIQLLFMGIPNGLVARDGSVPFRMLWNSCWTVAPTTVSLSMSFAFAGFLTLALLASAEGRWPAAAPFPFLLLWAAAVRRLLPRVASSPVPAPAGPGPAPVRRLIILNIDGVRRDVFDGIARPAIRSFAGEGAEILPGLRTVYRALTNPAFASILTGAPPKVHGVRNNNLGQRIRVEGLPDLVPTVLYGSMHVRHFSKPEWEVKVVPIAAVSCWRIDELALEELQRDLLARPEVRLFVFDISEADFVGHAYGSSSARYRESLERTDERLGSFFGWLRRQGLEAETAVIICSDHGIAGIDHSYLLAPSERIVPFIARGPGIRRSARIDGSGTIMDIGATAAAILGLRPPARSAGRILSDIFEPAGRTR
jgi:hypothetical protein